MLTFLGPILTPIVLQLIEWAISEALAAGADLDWGAIKAKVNAQLKAVIPNRLLEVSAEFVVDAFIDFVARGVAGGTSPGMALKVSASDTAGFAKHLVEGAVKARAVG